MRYHLLLAWRYVSHNRGKTAILVVCIALTVYLPVTVQLIVHRFEALLMERAEATPLVVGAVGSRVDLVLHALHFEHTPPAAISWAELERVQESGYAQAIPLHVRFRARGYPIVGTTLDYFDVRQLPVARGTQLQRLGDCVLGARVARELQIGPGDSLLSEPENVFDLAGAYPVKMRVVGVLAEQQTADDAAIFVDVKTAWVMEGIGHGHQDVAKADDERVVLERRDDEVVASAALPHYTEITEANLSSFHFHGEASTFPLTAVIAIPRDEKSETLLIARYDAPGADAQVLVPVVVVQELMEMIFKLKRFLDLTAALIGLTTLLFLALVILLSLRLRRQEMTTLFRMGCSRFTLFWLQASELGIILCMSAALMAGASAITVYYAPALLRQWLL